MSFILNRNIFYTFRKYYNIKHLPVNDLYGMGNLIKYCNNRVFLLLIDNTRIWINMWTKTFFMRIDKK